MSKVALPPTKPQTDLAIEKRSEKKPSNKAVLDVINKGGSPVQQINTEQEKVKNFNILMLETDLEFIKELCNKRPKNPLKKITLSKSEWILEAIHEKIDRERKKYGI